LPSPSFNVKSGALVPTCAPLLSLKKFFSQLI
jgi:hypothetical protein